MSQPLWSSDLFLGVPQMDSAHQDMLKELDDLLKADDLHFPALLSSWIGKVEHDFRAEENDMEKINFYDSRLHMEQHARMLAALHHTLSTVLAGNLTSGHEALELMASWFPVHISTMDRALSTALQTLPMELP